ncbi:MAG TPA: N-acyl homoserine lactonase family protein, partial [Aestuariivirgaceae bacterium]|nr:N-acyl homoserine lactonase family protein [Aestuariivirgaceae bacterium]
SLKALGVSPDDISIVVCSHLHPDHCGCNQFFRRSTIFVHARELAAAKAPGAEKSGYLASDFDNSVPMKVVEGETDLFGDGKIRLLPLPGHTPGTMGAFVTLDNSGAFLLAADSLSLRGNLDRNIVPRNTWNKEACLMTFERIRQIEADGAKIICGHDDGQWSGLRKGADAYD